MSDPRKRAYLQRVVMKRNRAKAIAAYYASLTTLNLDDLNRRIMTLSSRFDPDSQIIASV